MHCIIIHYFNENSSYFFGIKFPYFCESSSQSLLHVNIPSIRIICSVSNKILIREQLLFFIKILCCALYITMCNHCEKVKSPITLIFTRIILDRIPSYIHFELRCDQFFKFLTSDILNYCTFIPG